MTTVACVFVHGHVPFTVEYVTRLASMVRRWMDRPYRFVCLCDKPEELPAGIDWVSVPRPTLKGWWSKIELFNPERGLSGRVLYLDLDTLVVASLAPIIDYPAQFALAPDGGTFQPKNGLRVVKRFNSSVMVWDANTELPQRVWQRYAPSVPARLWGDQDFIGETCPEAATMPGDWFPRLSELKDEPYGQHAKVILAKKPKNIIAAKMYPWVREVWQ
jgi:hypothetical protein